MIHDFRRFRCLRRLWRSLYLLLRIFILYFHRNQFFRPSGYLFRRCHSNGLDTLSFITVIARRSLHLYDLIVTKRQAAQPYQAVFIGSQHIAYRSPFEARFIICNLLDRRNLPFHIRSVFCVESFNLFLRSICFIFYAEICTDISQPADVIHNLQLIVSQKCVLSILNGRIFIKHH